ncbi:MAG TPA: TIGR01777 family oxidoreductase [Longimicrobiales bacterium]
MRFAITGSTGLVGTELTQWLRSGGHEVTRIVRSWSGLPQGERAIVWHPEKNAIDAQGLEGHDVVIHLAGENIAGIWTDAKKRRIRESRARGTRLLTSTLAALGRPPRALIVASGFDVYGNRSPDQLIDERSAPGTGFLADVAVASEAATQPASDAGIRVIITRFGNVLSPRGGMLGVLLPFFRLGLGPRFGDGHQYWPWIAVTEIAPAMLHVLERPEIHGPVNLVAPEQVTNEQFTNTIAAVVGRPSFLSVPAFAAKLAPGGMAQELLLRGSRVVPRILLDTAYPFRFPQLKPALEALLR